jgi:hypothetical protein
VEVGGVCLSDLRPDPVCLAAGCGPDSVCFPVPILPLILSLRCG